MIPISIPFLSNRVISLAVGKQIVETGRKNGILMTYRAV